MIEIITDIASLESSDSMRIMGKIHISIGETNFPEKEWKML